ncbi:hypothetical protein GCM10009823_13360 [Brevibacterium salitolerans]|uniref:Sensor-like histidine kinase SenX3 n=1 Tax=Brevibacterium salitolerans TaxID=1403566 RepID=A0ABP5I8J9_9MICO
MTWPDDWRSFSSEHMHSGRSVRRVPRWVWLGAVVPGAGGALAAAALWMRGDQRKLEVVTALPAATVLTGLLLTALLLCGCAWWAIRARSRQRWEAQAAERARAAYALAVKREREGHRRFLARLDHELKNPVTAIRAAAASGGAQSGERCAEGKGVWAVVDAQSAKLAGLVGDLRKLAELETRALEYETVDLAGVLKEAVADLAHVRPDVSARISLSVISVPWQVPPLQADLDLLSLALDNVLSNAAKYSDSGPIEVRLREQDGWAVIEVADSGRGIPQDDQPYVFAELARANNVRDVPGSGIGLTLAATVIRRHGGDVALRSVEGAGTVVTLWLPVRV